MEIGLRRIWVVSEPPKCPLGRVWETQERNFFPEIGKGRIKKKGSVTP